MEEVCLIRKVGEYIRKNKISLSSDYVDVLINFAEWLEKDLGICIHKYSQGNIVSDNINDKK